MSICRSKGRNVQLKNLVAKVVPLSGGQPAESAIEAVGSMRRFVGTAEEQSRMAQQLQMIDGHGQQLATQPAPLMGWKKRKHDDFACGDVAETVPNQRRLVLCDESQQLTLSYLT
jgi:hypothetical protein